MKRHNSSTILLIFLVVLASSLFAQKKNSEIDQAINAFAEGDLFSGTVLVAKNGEIVYSRTVGFADKDFRVENTLETKFNIGSIGKTFTSTSIMQLAAAGKLNVFEPVVSYLPDFPFGNEITIHHLLTHTSGTGNYFAHPEFRNKLQTIRSVSDALPLIYDQPLLFTPPGDRFSYSNSGIVILGAVIEKVSGLPYAQYLKQNIFQPLDMIASGINYLEDVVPNRATGYTQQMDGTYKRNIFRVPPANADGGLETTVLDLLKFDQALYGTALLDAAHKKQMFTPYKNDYAYCWGVEAIFGDTRIGHSGGTTGVSAVFRRYIVSRYTIIVLSNYDNAASPVANTIEAILFDQPYSNPKQPIERYLYQALADLPLTEISTHFDDLLKNGDYQIQSSQVLNPVGYAFMGQQLMDLAIEVFKLNIRLFPDDANCYDSLGEAYMLKGDYDLSGQMYHKALEIDPGFENAKIMLKRLETLSGK